jgi:hypothetical protein
MLVYNSFCLGQQLDQHMIGASDYTVEQVIVMLEKMTNKPFLLAADVPIEQNIHIKSISASKKEELILILFEILKKECSVVVTLIDEKAYNVTYEPSTCVKNSVRRDR